MSPAQKDTCRIAQKKFGLRPWHAEQETQTTGKDSLPIGSTARSYDFWSDMLFCPSRNKTQSPRTFSVRAAQFLEPSGSCISELEIPLDFLARLGRIRLLKVQKKAVLLLSTRHGSVPKTNKKPSKSSPTKSHQKAAQQKAIKKPTKSQQKAIKKHPNGTLQPEPKPPTHQPEPTNQTSKGSLA